MTLSIYHAYLIHSPDIKPFFTIDIGDFESAFNLRCKNQYPFSDSEIDEIINWNKEVGNSSAAIENIRKLKSPKTVAIVTGQQPGLFTGPLYTIYKAINCIQIAAYVRQKFNYDAVPIFWVASEDSDFEEMRRIDWIDKDSQPRSFLYSPKEYKIGLSAFDIPVEPSLNEAIEVFISSTPNTEFKKSLIDLLREAIHQSKSINDLFSRLLAHLFGKYGLLLVSPHLNCIRKKSLPLIIKELSAPTVSSNCLIETNNELKKANFSPTVFRQPHQLNIFLYIDKVRTKLIYDKEKFGAINEEGKLVQSFEKSELINLANELPERFSTGIAMRPVVQDFIFPTIAYIGGPGEISYFASLKKVYEFFGVHTPMIYPRATVCLIEPHIKRILDKFNFAAENIFDDSENFNSELFHNLFKTTDIALEFGEIKTQHLNALEDFQENVKAEYKNLSAPFEKFAKLTKQNISKFEQKMLTELKNKDKEIQRYEQKIRSAFYHLNSPQERVFNIFVPFIEKYGFSLIDTLVKEIDPFTYTIQYIYLP